MGASSRLGEAVRPSQHRGRIAGHSQTRSGSCSHGRGQLDDPRRYGNCLDQLCPVLARDTQPDMRGRLQSRVWYRFVTWTNRRSVCRVRPVDCGKTADWICMPFGMMGPLGPRMRQLDGVGDCHTGSGSFGGKYGASHCNQGDL